MSILYHKKFRLLFEIVKMKAELEVRNASNYNMYFSDHVESSRGHVAVVRTLEWTLFCSYRMYLPTDRHCFGLTQR